MPLVTPEWEQVIRLAIEERLVDVRVALPAVVESYDPATQTVTATPQLKRVIPGLDDIGDIVEAYPPIPNVPVAFGRGGGAFVSFPLRAGDFGQLLFNDASIDLWRAQGVVVDPSDVRTHHFNGAVFLPVDLYPSKQVLKSAHAANLVVGFDKGAQVHVKPDGTVHLGEENAADFVALTLKVKAALDLFKTALTTAATTPPDGGTAFKASMVTALSALDTDVGASKVKAT